MMHGQKNITFVSIKLVQFPGQGREESRLVTWAHPTSYAENTVFPRG